MFTIFVLMSVSLVCLLIILIKNSIKDAMIGNYKTMVYPGIVVLYVLIMYFDPFKVIFYEYISPFFASLK